MSQLKGYYSALAPKGARPKSPLYPTRKRGGFYGAIYKDGLREHIIKLREKGMSYRQIGAELDIHWMRVRQILKKQADKLL